jgi:Zn-dependent protease/predicted transcriptional regulator
MPWSFQIAKIKGIPIRIHITFLLFIPVLAVAFALQPSPIGFGNIENAYVYGIIAALGLFGCVTIHELGHSLLAMRYGIRIESITLYMFGGVSAIEIPKNPRIELPTALIGPLVSVALGIIFLLPSFVITELVPNLFFKFFGYINLLLGGFNLIPAFPMDGGRVLRAILAINRPYLRATRTAVQIGKTLAVFMGLIGLFYNPFLIIIAFFIYIAASEEERQTSVSETLSGIKVKDIMTTDVITVSPQLNISELIDLMFERKHMGYPVVDNGKLVGIVTFTDARQVPVNRRDEIMVGNIMRQDLVATSPHEDASDVITKMSQKKVGRIPVVDGELLVGIVTRNDLTNAITLLTEARDDIIRPDGTIARVIRT